jgi:hypothetical protein
LKEPAKKFVVHSPSTGFAPFIHMFCTARKRIADEHSLRRVVAHYRNTVQCVSFSVLRLAAACALVLTMSVGAAADDTPLFRVFLKDGTTIASYGEFARVDDRVVLSLPLGESAGKPNLRLVSVPAGQVDWARTERYRDSVRAARYAATRGEADFTQMTADVADTLNAIARTADPARQLELAEAARRQLAGWGEDHYGYRVREIREIAALLDETISDLRAAAGRTDFDLNFVAIVEPPPPERLLPDPGPADRIAQAIALVDLADGPAERMTLLEHTLEAIDGSTGLVDGTALRSAREYVERRLERDRRADREYRRLAGELTGLARVRASRGDVHGVQALIARLAERDRRLGRERPQLVAAIAAALRHDLEGARAHRLQLDRWKSQVGTYRSYERRTRHTFAELARVRPALEDIRQLAGPDAEALAAVRRTVDGAERRLAAIVPPAGMSQVHDLLQSAVQMAQTAARVRQEAVAAGSLERAWSASAAAAGAQLLAARAREELGRLLQPPRVR